MVLHYAHLAVMAGGVETLLIGSEMAALTRVRGPGGSFPAAERLARLAADAKGIVGAGTNVSYGANWDEYGGQAFADGTLAFPLDVVWGSPAVDFVGIDYYAPLADWRDGADHLDAARAVTLYDRAYPEGEPARRRELRHGSMRTRPPRGAGAHAHHRWRLWRALGLRQKDLWSWWANAHHARPGGVREGAPPPGAGREAHPPHGDGLRAVTRGRTGPAPSPTPNPPRAASRPSPTGAGRFRPAPHTGDDDGSFDPAFGASDATIRPRPCPAGGWWTPASICGPGMPGPFPISRSPPRSGRTARTGRRATGSPAASAPPRSMRWWRASAPTMASPMWMPVRSKAWWTAMW